MSDWENDDEPQQSRPIPGLTRRFDDEDLEEDEIKDDWEAEDEPEPAPKPVAPPKKRVSVKQKIAEKEAEERRRRELGIEEKDEYQKFVETEEEARERLRREREAELEADLDNATSLIGDTKLTSTEPTTTSLANAKPSTKAEWEKFAEDVYAAVFKAQESRPGFDKHFFPHMLAVFARSTLRDVDLRKGSTRLRELAEEKAKAEKEAKRTGGNAHLNKNKPKPVGTSSAKNTVDLNAYGNEALDDDLDFM
ncbi:Translation initiation factor 3 subunit J component [Malassezia cuniculi]|uniref:Eukaryotic translation initiation factor 3 30 kDa subunit n=1 Tax=Malassezia cuniculi TaxID=948313 RepID=A0AAF0ENE1_9BASI|nr:Translation initiation factor 3 subunit J component [Malassezia cuniculi]